MQEGSPGAGKLKYDCRGQHMGKLSRVTRYVEIRALFVIMKDWSSRTGTLMEMQKEAFRDE